MNRKTKENFKVLYDSKFLIKIVLIIHIVLYKGFFFFLIIQEEKCVVNG